MDYKFFIVGSNHTNSDIVFGIAYYNKQDIKWDMELGTRNITIFSGMVGTDFRNALYNFVMEQFEDIQRGKFTDYHARIDEAATLMALNEFIRAGDSK